MVNKLRKSLDEFEKLSDSTIKFFLTNNISLSRLIYIINSYKKREAFRAKEILLSYNRAFQDNQLSIQHIYRLLKKLESLGFLKNEKIANGYYYIKK